MSSISPSDIKTEWKNDILIALKSKNVVARRSAALALEAYESPEVISALEEALADSDKAVRDYAENSLITLIKENDEIQNALTILNETFSGFNEETIAKSKKQIDDALDLITSKCEYGNKVLLDRLYQNMELVRSEGQTFLTSTPDFVGDEWYRKQRILKAFSRKPTKNIVQELILLLNVRSKVSQYYSVLQPTIAEVLGEIGDKQAIEPLYDCFNSDNVFSESRIAISVALQKLTGNVLLDPRLIIAEADKKLEVGDKEAVLPLLEQIDSSMFNSLSARDKYYIWYLRGLVYRAQGDKEKAIERFQSSLNYFNAPEAAAHYRLKELLSK